MKRPNLTCLTVHLISSPNQADWLNAVAGSGELALPTLVVISGALDDLIDRLGIQLGVRRRHLHLL
jgi:hypothetical protein